MRSDQMKKGLERAPHRSLFKALGLTDREIDQPMIGIAHSVESMGKAYPFDGLVLIPNCDKVVPGMMMAMARLDIPSILISGGPMLTGDVHGKGADLITLFECF